VPNTKHDDRYTIDGVLAEIGMELFDPGGPELAPLIIKRVGDDGWCTWADQEGTFPACAYCSTRKTAKQAYDYDFLREGRLNHLLEEIHLLKGT